MGWYKAGHGKKDTKDSTASFVHNRNRENIKSGEKHSIIFGKIARYFADLKLVAFTGSYDDLNGKPSSFPPSSHTHTKSQVSDFAHTHKKAEITDFPTSMPASDVYAWAKAANKPSYSWNEVTNKPTSMPASDVYSWAKAANKPFYSLSEITDKDNIYTKKIISSYDNKSMILLDNSTIYITYHASYNNSDVNCFEFSNLGVVKGAPVKITFAPVTGYSNYANLGDNNKKWADIYCNNSTISTSDRNEKTRISYIGQDCGFDDTFMSDECVYDFVMGLLACIYNRVDADSGRPHHGFIAQDVKQLMDELGMTDHAAFIKSPKYINVEYEEEETYVDETDGQTKTRTVTKNKPELVPGEYVYGLRYEEFIPDITRVLQIQDKKIKEQDMKINSLEERLSLLENMVKAS